MKSYAIVAGRIPTSKFTYKLFTRNIIFFCPVRLKLDLLNVLRKHTHRAHKFSTGLGVIEGLVVITAVLVGFFVERGLLDFLLCLNKTPPNSFGKLPDLKKDFCFIVEETYTTRFFDLFFDLF